MGNVEYSIGCMNNASTESCDLMCVDTCQDCDKKIWIPDQYCACENDTTQLNKSYGG